MRKVELRSDMSPVDFQLEPGKALRLGFVDGAGDPVPGVWNGIERWRGGKSLYNDRHPNVLESKIPRAADEKGIVTWSWAPDDEVTYRFGKEGYAEAEASITADGKEHVITLHPLLSISGSVRDAKTRAAVNRFEAVPVIYFRPNFLYVNRDDAVEGSDGQFEIEFERTDIEHGVRIEAIGYRTQLLGPWKIGDANPVLDIELEQAAPVEGVVVDASGRPVSNARVYLGTHTQHVDIRNHEQESLHSDDLLHVTDAEGRFTFERVPPIKCKLMGYLSVWEDFPPTSSQSVPLDLQPRERLTIDLNGEGTDVTGRVVLTGPTRREIDLSYSINYLLAL